MKRSSLSDDQHHGFVLEFELDNPTFSWCSVWILELLEGTDNYTFPRGLLSSRLLWPCVSDDSPQVMFLNNKRISIGRLSGTSPFVHCLGSILVLDCTYQLNDTLISRLHAEVTTEINRSNVTKFHIIDRLDLANSFCLESCLSSVLDLKVAPSSTQGHVQKSRSSFLDCLIYISTP